MTKLTDRPTNEDTSAWMQSARAAAVTMGIWAAALQFLAREVIPPVLIIGIVFVAFVPFLQGRRRWVALGLAVFATLALLGNLPLILDELANPESTPAFILTTLSVVAALIAVASGLGVFLDWSAAPVRPLVGTAAALFALAAGASVVIGLNTDSAEALASDVRVTAEKVSFTPGAVTLGSDAGGVWIDNRDGIRHTFTIEELGIDVEIPALKARRVDIDAPAGTYAIVCGVPGHEAMTGTLVVEE